MDSIPGSGRSSGERNGNPLQYSCLGNLMGRGAWRAIVHGVAKVGHDLMTKQQQQQGCNRIKRKYMSLSCVIQVNDGS